MLETRKARKRLVQILAAIVLGAIQIWALIAGRPALFALVVGDYHTAYLWYNIVAALLLALEAIALAVAALIAVVWLLMVIEISIAAWINRGKKG